MSTPTALQQQLAQVQSLAPQSQVPDQVMQQVLPDASNPQMPEAATLPGIEQVLPPAQQPTEYNQLTQPPQAQQMPQQQQGIAQQPPQQMTQQDQQLNMMHGRLRAANDEIRQLKQQVAISQAQPNSVEPQQAAPPKQITAADVTDAECIEHFGQEYFDEWGDAVKQQLATFRNMMSSIQPAQQPVQQNVDQVQKLSNQFFHGELSRLVPNYQTVETDPRFDVWLNSNMDAMSGMSYNDWLTDAYSEGDAQRAAHIFRMFLGQGAGAPVYNQQQPMQQQAPQQVYQPQQMQQYQMPVNQPLQQAVMPVTTGAPMPTGNAAPAMSKAQCLQALAALPTQGLSPLEMSTKQAELTALMKTAQAAPQMQQMQHAAPGW